MAAAVEVDLARLVLCGLTALAVGMPAQAGGVILERTQTVASGSCRQGGVEWLGAGGKLCPATVRAAGIQGGPAPEQAAPRSEGAVQGRGSDEARRQILLQELSQERARLASLQVSAREPGMSEAIQRARQDVIALERELARLAP